MNIKPRIVWTLLMIFCLSLSCAMVSAQTSAREKYLIYAKAGLVNFVSGQTTVQRKGETVWRALNAKDDLNAGDVVKTGTSGQLEVLLNPGSYLRVAADSEFAFTNTALDELRLKLREGSAIVEASGLERTHSTISIETTQTEVTIAKQGLYRINALPGTNRTEVLVRRGKATVDAPSSTQVKSGNRIVVGSELMAVAKFDRKAQDALDVWSWQRAEKLAQINRSLTNGTLNTAIASFGATGFDAGRDWRRRSFRNNYGVWILDPQTNCYTFVPFSGDYTSAYGSSYSGIIITSPGGSGATGGSTGVTPTTSTEPTQARPRRNKQDRDEDSDVVENRTEPPIGFRRTAATPRSESDERSSGAA
jgi:hypothetical protein